MERRRTAGAMDAPGYGRRVVAAHRIRESAGVRTQKRGAPTIALSDSFSLHPFAASPGSGEVNMVSSGRTIVMLVLAAAATVTPT